MQGQSTQTFLSFVNLISQQNLSIHCIYTQTLHINLDQIRHGRDLVVGLLHGSGEHYAKCEHFYNGNKIFAEGGYLLLGSYDRARPYENTIQNHDVRPKEEVLNDIRRYVKRFLTKEDHEMLHKVTGYPTAELLAELENENPKILMKVLTNDRWIYSDANKKGLHLLRCLLAERIADARRREKGLHLHPDYETFMRDGVLMKDFSKLTNEDVTELLMMASGYDISDIPALNWQLRVVKGDYCDLNLDLHVDTYQPSWKLWLYAEDIDESQGPTSYVIGSHRNNENKLRW